MSRFLSRLIVSPLADGFTWYLDTEFKFDQSNSTLRQPITVPKGFETDFASIPSPLTAILPKWGIYGPAAIIHDWIYWMQPVSRKEADDILLEGMATLNVSPIVRGIIYRGVRWFGCFAWRSNSKLRSQGVKRMRPPDAEWPAFPTWSRRRWSLGYWITRRKLSAPMK